MQKPEMAKKGQLTMGTFILVFITILVGVVFFAPINEAVSAANASGTTQTILDLVPLFYVLLILAVAAVPVIVAFRRAK